MESRSRAPDEGPPLVVDIDGTLTDRSRAVDPRVVPVLREWPAPVVVATGKAMPYPVALCEFVGLDQLAIAENGGVVVVGPTGTLQFEGDRAAAEAVAEEYRARGHELGWDGLDLANRWRETELVVSRDSPLEPLEEIATDHGLEVIDTGYAYHVKTPGVTKGEGLVFLSDQLDLAVSEFVAVGDSINDVSAFERVDRAVAVANADDAALAAADHVTDARYGAGFLEAVRWLTER